MRQFRVENSCLQPVHATVNSFHDVIAFAAAPRECCHPIGEPIVIGHNASSIPIGAQVLSRIKSVMTGEGMCVSDQSSEIKCQRCSTNWITFVGRLSGSGNSPKKLPIHSATRVIISFVISGYIGNDRIRDWLK